MENDSNDKRPPEYYTEINVLEKKEEILNLLKSYNPVVHTNSEKDFDWLSDDGVSIIVSKGAEELLYVDLDGEITLGMGGWHTHYAAYLMDYNLFKETLLEFIEGKLCAVSIKCDEKWMGSYMFYESEISVQNLVTHTYEFLSATEFRDKLDECGFIIQCSFLDSSKDRVFVIERSTGTFFE